MKEALSFDLWGSYPPHAGQWPAWEQRHRLWTDQPPIMFTACGPQWGKDRLTVRVGLELSLGLLAERLNDGSDLLPPFNGWVVAPTREDLTQVWREFVSATKDLFPIVNRSDREIILFGDPTRPEDTGAHWKFKSGWEPDRMVAEPVDVLYITEGAKLPTETYDLARSRLASRGRAAVELINGTPTEHPSTWYRALFRRGEAGDPGVIYTNQPSWANPTLDKRTLGKLQEIKKSTSLARWRANWGGELLPAGSQLFPNLIEVMTALPKPPEQGAEYVKIYDPAGRGKDRNALSTWRVDGPFYESPEQVDLELWQGKTTKHSKARIRSKCVNYPGTFAFDNNGRLWMEDEIRDLLSDLPETIRAETWDPRKKAEMVDATKARFEERAWALLHPSSCDEAMVQKGELEDFEERISPSGRTVQYTHPEGGHDDTVTGVLGAAWIVRTPMVDTVAQLEGWRRW